MDDEPNPLSPYDLAAWEPPAPPAGIADTVVTRMTRQPPPAGRAHVAAPAPSLRTVFAAAGATLVASAAVAVLVMTHEASPSTVTAQVSSPTSLAPVNARPLPRPSSAAGGTAEDDAHIAALEKRVLELEVAIEQLRVQIQLQQQRSLPQKPAPVTPLPAVVEPREVEPFDMPHGPAPAHDGRCDPFANVHGCKIDPLLPAGPDDGPVSPTGKVHVESKPVAHVAIDGLDTGQTTPAVLVLPTGKHKITLAVNGDRYTYSLTIEPGQTLTFVKDLE